MVQRKDSTVSRRRASTIVNLESLFPKNFRCSSPFQWRRTGNHLPFPWWKVLFSFFFVSITVAAIVTGTMIVTALADSVARTFCPSLANDIYTRRVLCSLELVFLRLPTATWSPFSHFFTLLSFVRTVEAFCICAAHTVSCLIRTDNGITSCGRIKRQLISRLHLSSAVAPTTFIGLWNCQ